jgi:hypothetical protein
MRAIFWTDTMGTALEENGPIQLENYSPSLEVLKEAGVISEIENKPLIKSLKEARKKSSLSSIVDRLRNRQLHGEEYDYYHSHDVRLERIKQTKNAVFQVSIKISFKMNDNKNYD